MLTITICVGSSCSVRGSDELARALEELIAKEGLNEQIELVGAFCMENCSTGVSVRLGDQIYRELHPEDAEAFLYGVALPHLHREEKA